MSVSSLSVARLSRRWVAARAASIIGERALIDDELIVLAS
jgi:hypothetical protein